ncbi:hypothetical protein BMF35_a1045 [Aurantiacibacter gangjinensis]|nr:hypothetical protein BMF35_a1045 [Aurantiacibacter gangjinensis]
MPPLSGNLRALTPPLRKATLTPSVARICIQGAFQSAWPGRAVRLPESFRGGCSFGGSGQRWPSHSPARPAGPLFARRFDRHVSLAAKAEQRQSLKRR